MKTRTKWAIALALLALLTGLLGLWAWRERSEVAQRRREMAQIRQRQSQLAAFVRQHGELDECAARWLDEDATLDLYCPPTLDVQQISSEINLAALRAGLSLRKLTWGAAKPALPKPQAAACVRRTIEVQAHGSYFAWLDFLRALEQGRRFLTISRVGATADGNGLLSGTVAITVFAKQ